MVTQRPSLGFKNMSWGLPSFLCESSFLHQCRSHHPLPPLFFHVLKQIACLGHAADYPHLLGGIQPLLQLLAPSTAIVKAATGNTQMKIYMPDSPNTLCRETGRGPDLSCPILLSWMIFPAAFLLESCPTKACFSCSTLNDNLKAHFSILVFLCKAFRVGEVTHSLKY